MKLTEWRQFSNTLTRQEKDIIFAAIETLRKQVRTDPHKHGVVVIEKHGRKAQVYETNPIMFVDYV